jgi:hypothetical protein
VSPARRGRCGTPSAGRVSTSAAEPGDSGDCEEGGDTFFQPVQEVLDRYGLTLETN